MPEGPRIPRGATAPAASTRRVVAVAAAAALALLVLFVPDLPGNVTPPAITLVSIGPTGGNGNFDSRFSRASADGSRVFFDTWEQLAEADQDATLDVYERFGGTVTLVSTGPAHAGGAFNAIFQGASADGSHVFFETAERLVSADTDSRQDVYERSGGTTTLVSTGPAGGNGSFSPRFWGASADGTRVFFATAEKLVRGDTDSQIDIYTRFDGTTTLVSSGPAGGNGAFGATFQGASADGSRVLFDTWEQLVGADQDATLDVYERSGGTTTLVSTGPDGGNGNFEALFRGASAGGSRVFFVTHERLLAADEDTSEDVYMRTMMGTTALVSTGPAGGNGAFLADFRGASATGSRVFFEAAERLVSADTDSGRDIYERSGGTTTLLSTGPAGGNGAFHAHYARASTDGSRVFFHTDERLVSVDTDSRQDVYERSGGTTTLLSAGAAGGNGALDAWFFGASADGSRVFFMTREKLVETDQDTSVDVYQRSGGTTRLVSAGPAGGNGAFDARYAGASADGSRVFFTTREKLVSADTDERYDVYQLG